MPKRNIISFALTLGSIILAYSCATHRQMADECDPFKPTATSLEHGRNLTYNVCGPCHYNEKTGKFSGNRFAELPSALGKVYTSNLTHAPKCGMLSEYTDAQLAYLVKTGIKNDGHFTPFMLRPTIADRDIADIVLFLRSDDPALAADNTCNETHLTLLGKIGIHAIKPKPFITHIGTPAPTDSVGNGRYLVDILGCYHCHSGSLLSLNYMKPQRSKHYLKGGHKFKDPYGEKLYAANLTPDDETGTGFYTKETFRTALQTGVMPEGDTLSLPMPAYRHLTNTQADYIYAYLQSLRPKHTRDKDKEQLANTLR